jgi:hypothetical protein
MLFFFFEQKNFSETKILLRLCSVDLFMSFFFFYFRVSTLYHSGFD